MGRPSNPRNNSNEIFQNRGSKGSRRNTPCLPLHKCLHQLFMPVGWEQRHTVLTLTRPMDENLKKGQLSNCFTIYLNKLLDQNCKFRDHVQGSNILPGKVFPEGLTGILSNRRETNCHCELCCGTHLTGMGRWKDPTSIKELPKIETVGTFKWSTRQFWA